MEMDWFFRAFSSSKSNRTIWAPSHLGPRTSSGGAGTGHYSSVDMSITVGWLELQNGWLHNERSPNPAAELLLQD